MKKFEYLSEKVGRIRLSDFIDETLDELGRQGWELVSVVPVTVDGDSHAFRFFFKREITE